MANDPRQKARDDVKRAQTKVERAKGMLEEAMATRRASFQRARAAGLSLAEIGEASNLHRSRVDQILREN